MIRTIRGEAYKLVTTRTTVSVVAAMIALISLAVLLHAFGLPRADLRTEAQQRGILTDVGVNLAILFAALLGALSITSEFRTGTIRPTFLLTPRRAQVIAGKTVCVFAAGAVIALLAAGTAAVTGSLGLAIRGVSVQVTAGDATRLLVGATTAGALWAAIGLGVGAVLRAQVPSTVGLFAWLLFVEQVLAGDVPRAHRFVPGGLAQALAGPNRDSVLSSATLAAVLLLAYTAATVLAGLTATRRRDVA
jgi:ABC-type transport system involved in multi-copper enzyme maturation permease subunit